MLLRVVGWGWRSLTDATCMTLDGSESMTVEIPAALNAHGKTGFLIVVKDGEFMSFVEPMREPACAGAELSESSGQPASP